MGAVGSHILHQAYKILGIDASVSVYIVSIVAAVNAQNSRQGQRDCRYCGDNAVGYSFHISLPKIVIVYSEPYDSI